MGGDLRRPGDRPQTPDTPDTEAPDAVIARPPNEPLAIRDSYVDDPDDIFDRPPAWNQRRSQAGDGGSGAPIAPDDELNDNDAADDEAEADASDADADARFDFDPRRAGLEDLTAQDAATYIAANRNARPWLTAAEGRNPQVQRVYAALDSGQGHALPRHDDYGDDELYQRRVAYLEDPAQLDDAKRAAGIDGTKPGDKNHYCAEYATRIHDPDAFATCFRPRNRTPDRSLGSRSPL